MPPSEQTRQFRTLERRRMIRVKDALAAGIDAEPPATGFVAACIDYLEFIIGRFLHQGEGNIRRLCSIVPASDAADRKILTDIENTLASTRTQLQELISARDAWREGHSTDSDLRTACQAFLTFYNQILAHRKDPVQEIIAKYMEPETYWKQTDDVTADTIETEAKLFDELQASAPQGVQLEEPG